MPDLSVYETKTDAAANYITPAAMQATYMQDTDIDQFALQTDFANMAPAPMIRTVQQDVTLNVTASNPIADPWLWADLAGQNKFYLFVVVAFFSGAQAVDVKLGMQSDPNSRISSAFHAVDTTANSSAVGTMGAYGDASNATGISNAPGAFGLPSTTGVISMSVRGVIWTPNPTRFWFAWVPTAAGSPVVERAGSYMTIREMPQPG